MDRRYVCEACGTKWFVPGGGGPAGAPPDCGACGVRLVDLAPALSLLAEGGHPRLPALAEDIVESQRREIAQMRERRAQARP